MKTIAIHKSKTGYTKKYAEWIAEELSADLFTVSEVTSSMLKEYDTIIFGSGLYASGIPGIKLIKQNFDQLKGKKIIIFATGLSIPSDTVINEVKNRNFTPEQQAQIKFFYLRGGFDYSKLSRVDKILMSLLKWKITNKKKKGEELTPDEVGMLNVYDKSVDFTRKKNIEEILNYLKA